MKFVIVFYLSFLQCFSQCLCIGTVPLEKLNQSLQIQTLRGIIQGSEHTTFNEKKSFYSFVGIPYARPPIGYLRFKDPKPMPKWIGVLDATRLGPCCAGLDSSGVSSLDLRASGQEDCLYLNVYTPMKNLTSPKEALAVMVYFYGGAFFSGCSNEYGADFFMEENVILVVPNFRISIFGYLSTDDLECPGNWASKDQIAVLKWLQLNIYKFGGNSKKITIFGQSAGAANVNTLLLSQRAQDLFHRAILISGSSLAYWSYQLNPKKVAFDIGIGLGLETNDSEILMGYLRSVDGEDLQQVQVPTILTNLPETLRLGLPLAAVKEPLHKEAVLTDDPYTILEKGRFNKVPVMIGVTTREGAYYRRIIHALQPFMDMINLSPGLLVRIGKEPRLRTKAALKVFDRFINTSNVANAQEADLINLISEDGYYRPSRKTADFLAQHSPVYFYQFSYEGEKGFKYRNRRLNLHESNRIKNISDGVVHTEDLAYLFTFKDIGMNFSKKDLNMAKKITKLYTNFAREGNPTPKKDASLDNVTWPIVIPPKFPYMRIGEQLEQVLENFNDNNFRFWEQLYEAFAVQPYKVF
ncbi:juvenile hormone esterase-like [Euwallacea fornicatus]|uniref:juvenile hormone esterase-like n=1 Tax=Euwallacea fornicatus TaxID=995702 RepID=UPI00338FAFDD